MNNLATVLQDMGQHAEAAELHRRGLEMSQQVLGDRHPDTLSSMNNLANALQGMGQHAEAAELHQRGLEMRRQVLGDRHPGHTQQHEQPGCSNAGRGTACRGG